MTTYQGNLTETIAQVADQATRVAVQTITMASAENNQNTEYGTHNMQPINETTNNQLVLHRQVHKTKEIQNGGKEHVSKL